MFANCHWRVFRCNYIFNFHYRIISFNFLDTKRLHTSAMSSYHRQQRNHLVSFILYVQSKVLNCWPDDNDKKNWDFNVCERVLCHGPWWSASLNQNVNFMLAVMEFLWHVSYLWSWMFSSIKQKSSEVFDPHSIKLINNEQPNIISFAIEYLINFLLCYERHTNENKITLNTEKEKDRKMCSTNATHDIPSKNG